MIKPKTREELLYDLQVHDHFITGKPFWYTGTFMRLQRHALYYDERLNQVIDRTVQDWKDAEDEYPTWEVQDILPEGFTLFKSTFGKIRINYNECRLKEPVKTNA